MGKSDQNEWIFELVSLRPDWCLPGQDVKIFQIKEHQGLDIQTILDLFGQKKKKKHDFWREKIKKDRRVYVYIYIYKHVKCMANPIKKVS